MVGVGAQQVDGQRVALAELGGYQERSDGEELQLLAGDGAGCEEPVQVAHGQREHLLFALLLLAYLQVKEIRLGL